MSLTGFHIQPWRIRGALAALAVAACLLSVTGCSSLDVRVEKGIHARPQWTVAVLPFDDAGTQHVAADYSFYGYTGGQGSGAVVARIIARAFEGRPDFQTVGDPALHRLVHDDNLSIREIALMDDAAACALARKLKADMVIRGRVFVYKTSWVVFVPRSEIVLELRGLDSDDAQLLWTAHTRYTSYIHSESTLVARVADRIILAVGEEVLADPGTK